MAVTSNWAHPFLRRHIRPYIFSLDFAGDLLTTRTAVILAALESLFLAIRVYLLRSRPMLGYWVGALLALILLFAHLYALGIYGVLWFGICLDELLLRRTRSSAVITRNLEFLPALVLFGTMRTGEIF